MAQIILTAFEPFLGRKANKSLEVLQNVMSDNVKGLEAIVFPVAFRDFEREFKHIRKHKPRYILSMGESPYESPKLERKAKNFIECKGRPDNDGRIIEKERIIEHAPDFYLATMDYDSIALHVKKAKYKIKRSSNAGSYVCNFLLYRLLHEFNDASIGFIHVPNSGKVGYSTDVAHIVIDFLKK